MLKIEKFTDVCMTGGMHYTPSHTNVSKFYNYNFQLTAILEKGLFKQNVNPAYIYNLNSYGQMLLLSTSTFFILSNL